MRIGIARSRCLPNHPQQKDFLHLRLSFLVLSSSSLLCALCVLCGKIFSWLSFLIRVYWRLLAVKSLRLFFVLLVFFVDKGLLSILIRVY